MNKPSTTAKTVEARHKLHAPAHTDSAPKQVLPPVPKQDPKETAQEAVHQVMPKGAAKKLVKAAAANDVVNVTPQAAKGDDDLMSKQEKKS